MRSRPTRSIRIDALRSLMERLLEAGGCRPEIARPIADVFLEANLRGVTTQGLHHLIRGTLSFLTTGRMEANATPSLVKEGPAFALIDGHRGPGQLAGIMAADLAVKKAKEAGSVAIGIVNTSDLFMTGYYAERIARGGCITFGFSDSTPLVHAAGGAERVFGTNPLWIGIPTAGAHPIVLDMATSNWSAGHVRYAWYHGEKIPLGVAVDREGRPTQDPEQGWYGALSPFGGHKGSGLGMFVGFLSGPLVGAQTGSPLANWIPDAKEPPGIKGHLILTVDPGAFGDPERFLRSARDHVAQLQASRLAPGARAIRIPGERAFAERERSLRAGTVPILEVVWEQTRKTAAELGVAMPD